MNTIETGQGGKEQTGNRALDWAARLFGRTMRLITRSQAPAETEVQPQETHTDVIIRHVLSAVDLTQQLIANGGTPSMETHNRRSNPADATLIVPFERGDTTHTALERTLDMQVPIGDGYCFWANPDLRDPSCKAGLQLAICSGDSFIYNTGFTRDKIDGLGVFPQASLYELAMGAVQHAYSEIEQHGAS